VAVCLESLVNGQCPAGKRANLPLVEPLRFQAHFVLAERGVFQGLNIAGDPLEITQVRTSTAINIPLPAPAVPYHLAAFLRASTSGMVAAGFRYVNRIGGGFYEIEPQLRYEGREREGVAREIWLTYVQPIR